MWVSDVGYCVVVSMGNETGTNEGQGGWRTSRLTIEGVCGRKKVLFASMDREWTEHLQPSQRQSGADTRRRTSQTRSTSTRQPRDVALIVVRTIQSHRSIRDMIDTRETNVHVWTRSYNIPIHLFLPGRPENRLAPTAE